MAGGDRDRIDVRYVRPSGDAPDLAGAAPPGVDVTAAEAPGVPDRADCVVAYVDAECGATALDRATTPDVPTVAVVDADDGTVPAAVLDAEAVVRTDAVEAVPDRTFDAVERVTGRSGPPVAESWPSDDRSSTEWKADLFDLLFTDLPLHLFVKNADAEHVVVNEASVGDPERYLGRTDLDHGVAPADRDEADHAPVPPQEGRQSYEDDLQVLETGDPVVDREEYFSTFEDWHLTTKVPIEDDGEVRGLVGVARDITEQKEREQQLEVINHLLRHTLRNELNVVRGYAARIRRGEADDARREAGRIVDAVDDLLGGIDKQKEIVGILADGEDPRPRDVAAVARRVVAEASERFPAATVDHDLPASARAQAVDGLDRAIEELVENAVLHAERERPTVTVRVERADGEVRIHVADDGPPIPEMEVEILTGDRSIDQLNHGSGIGLWLVHWVVRRSEGRLAFEARDDGGNVVTVALPRAD